MVEGMGTVSRSHLPAAGRIVVKIGSSSLTEASGALNQDALVALVDVLAHRHRNTHIVLVSSGAIAAGLTSLGVVRQPQDLPTLQSAASVGQGLLVAAYRQAFGRHNVTVGQVLLTAEGLVNCRSHSLAHQTLERLLSLGVIPIVNENDTVATDEISFGDNDRLAALVAHLVHAEALILLTDVDALYSGRPHGDGQPVREVAQARRVPAQWLGSASGPGTGGMRSKVQAAAMATESGIPTLIGSASRLEKLLAGTQEGTFFPPVGTSRPIRLSWLMYLARPAGCLRLDSGAVEAIRATSARHGGADLQRCSLLSAGITGLEGAFEAGEPVNMVAPEGGVVARGLVGYSSRELPAMMGCGTGVLVKRLGEEYSRPVVHASDLVLL